METRPQAPPARTESTYAIPGFDGEATQIVKADKIAVCVPTANCVKFWAMLVACFIGLGVGILFVALFPVGSVVFEFGLGLATLAFGILVPSPPYNKLKVPGLPRPTPPPTPEARGLPA
jgi:hypothetical protein